MKGRNVTEFWHLFGLVNGPRGSGTGHAASAALRAASLDADDLGDGVWAVGAGPGDALAPVDELVAGVPQTVAVEVVALAAQPAADEGRGAALQPAGAPAELRLEVLQGGDAVYSADYSRGEY